MKLSPQAQQMADLLLKHYPLASQQTHPQHQHLHDYRKEREIYEKPTGEKLQNMEFFKEEGNNHYKNQRYSQASYFYQKVIIYADYTFPDNEEDNNRMANVLQSANCNMALSLIKLDRWDEAKVNLTQATKGRNVGIRSKGYYWLTKLHMRKAEKDKARAALNNLRALGADYSAQVGELQRQLLKLDG